MTGWDRFFVSLWAGLLAGMIALDLGVPLWRDWQIGDASDFAMTTGFLVWGLLKLAPSKGSAA